MTVSREGTGRRIGTYGIAVGFFYTVNFSVGIGFLNLPYAFYHAGVLVSCITVLVIGFFNVVTSLWIVETMSRAQALEYRSSGNMIQNNSVTSSDNHDLVLENEKDDEETPLLQTIPQYEIRSDRKFDGPEMCEMFLGKPAKFIYLLIMLIGVFLDLWIKGTVAATAWSSNIPLSLGIFDKCTTDDLEGVSIHPEGNCWNNYALCIVLFGLIVVPLSCLELSEQKWFQVALSVTRLFVILTMIIYCIAKTSMESNPTHDFSQSNFSRMSDDVSPTLTSNNWISGSIGGWLAAIPIFAFTQAIQVNLPTLTQPIEPKKRLRELYSSALLTLMMLYIALGIAVTAYFQSSVRKTATLGWEPLTSSDHSIFLRIMAYIIVLFPSIDVTSAYPLGVTVVTNVIHSAMGHDSLRSPSLHSRRTRVVYRIVFAALPLIGATFVTELGTLLRYEGLMTYIVFWVFPALMQYSSMKLCKRVFGLASSVRQSIRTADSDAQVVTTKRGDELKTPYSTVFSNNWIVVLALLFACFLISGSIAGIALN